MNSEKTSFPGLELEQNLGFQRRSWRVQRVAWVIMALVVLAALLGLFGSGPLSSASIGNVGDPLRVEYERFGRLRAPLITNVKLAPGTGSADGRLRLWISRAYLSRVAGEGISPIPESTLTAADRVIFVFRLTDPNQPVEATFYLNTERVGLLSGQIGLVGRPQVLSIRQFIYP